MLFLTRRNDPSLIGIPMTNPMGWVSSPPNFSACTETVADMANVDLDDSDVIVTTRQWPHCLDGVSESRPVGKPTPYPSAAPSAAPSAVPTSAPRVVPSLDPRLVLRLVPSAVPRCDPGSVPTSLPGPNPSSVPSSTLSSNPSCDPGPSRD